MIATRASAPYCSPISWTPPASPSASVTTRPWHSSGSTTRSSAMRWARRAAARSSTPVTASWRASFQPWLRRAARHGFIAPWPNTRIPATTSRSRFGSARPPASLSRIIWISSAQPFNLRRACARTLSRRKAWCRTWLRELCIGKGLAFQDLGEVSLRGFDRPNPGCTRFNRVASAPRRRCGAAIAASRAR